MSIAPGPPDDSPLEAHEIERMRQVLGTPKDEQSDRAVEEVQRQVAIEDLVLLMVEGITEAAHAFFSFIGEMNRDTTAERASGPPTEEEP